MKINYILFLSFLLLSSSCKKEDYISFMEHSISMHYDEQQKLSLAFSSEELSTLQYSYHSGDTNVVLVNASGLCSGVAVGTAVVTATSSDGQYKTSCIVQIVPKHKLFKDFYTGWGATVATVKSNETRRLKSESDSLLLFYGEYNYIKEVFYRFGNNDHLLNYAGIRLGKPSGITQNIVEYYKERYLLVDSTFVSDGYYTLFNFKHRTKNIYCYLYYYYFSDYIDNIFTSIPDAKQEEVFPSDKLAASK